jgi:hypothetical protein
VKFAGHGAVLLAVVVSQKATIEHATEASHAPGEWLSSDFFSLWRRGDSGRQGGWL